MLDVYAFKDEEVIGSSGNVLSAKSGGKQQKITSFFSKGVSAPTPSTPSAPSDAVPVKKAPASPKKKVSSSSKENEDVDLNKGQSAATKAARSPRKSPLKAAITPVKAAVSPLKAAVTPVKANVSAVKAADSPMKNNVSPKKEIGSPMKATEGEANGSAMEESGSVIKAKRAAKKARVEEDADEEFCTFECAKCEKVFETLAKLKAHSKYHNNRTYECTLCGVYLRSKATLKTHMDSHSGIKNFECTVCGNKFSQNSHLKVHMRTHTKEKPYKCEFCDKCFSVSNGLKVHRRIHTGEKPYKCDVCEKAFVESGKLKIHMRVHTNETPYQCMVCNERFKQKVNLRKHTLNFHTEEGLEAKYECQVCGKKFRENGYLKVHMKYHTGEKRFACEQCPKKFTTAGELTLHNDYHAGNKRFKCTICAKEYYQQPHLKHHMKMHNSGKRQCPNCKRFFGVDSKFNHKCLPKARAVSDRTKRKIKMQAGIKPRREPKVTPNLRIDDEVTQSGFTEDEAEDNMDMTLKAKLEAKKMQRGRPPALGGRQDNAGKEQTMVSLLMDIKEEAPDEDETEELDFETVLTDSRVKVQRSFTYPEKQNVEDEMMEQEFETEPEFILGNTAKDEHEMEEGGDEEMESAAAATDNIEDKDSEDDCNVVGEGYNDGVVSFTTPAADKQSDVATASDDGTKEAPEQFTVILHDFDSF